MKRTACRIESLLNRVVRITLNKACAGCSWETGLLLSDVERADTVDVVETEKVGAIKVTSHPLILKFDDFLGARQIGGRRRLTHVMVVVSTLSLAC